MPPSRGVWLQDDGRGPAQPHLSDRVRQSLHDLLVRRGHHALPVDLNDAMAHADAPSLRDAPAHEAADLSKHVSGQHGSQPHPERGGRRPQDKEVGVKNELPTPGGVWEPARPSGPPNGVGVAPQLAEPLFHVGGEDAVGGSGKAHSGRFSTSQEDTTAPTSCRGWGGGGG